MSNFSFVILHYQTYTDTVDCVESILKNIEDDTAIVIVNNGSLNNSGKKLEDRYSGERRVHYVNSKENLGFAKGNNLGFDFAKHTLKADFICLLNNDTIIMQKDFVKKVIEKYEHIPFHILGPDIVSTVDGLHQNPEVETCYDLDSTLKKRKHYKNLLFLNKLGVEKTVVGIKRKILPVKKVNVKEDAIFRNESTNVKLHGSCLIFSKDYIANYDGLFPKTFMYGEESILNFIVKRDGLLTLYSPEVQIFHKEDSSTNYQFPKDSRKRRFYYRNLIHSLNLLIELMKSEEAFTAQSSE